MVMHPVGPLPAATYWRRRGVVLAAAVVLLLVLRSCTGGGSSGQPRAGHPTPTPSGPSVATAPPRATAAPVVGTCRDAELAVTAAPDAQRYPPGGTARFQVAVTSTASTACRRDLGTAQVEVVVRSGADRIWSSQDCPRPGTKAREVVLLKPRDPVRTTVTWAGTRSRPGCTGSRDTARVGTYTVRVSVGAVGSPVVVFKVSRP